MIVLSMEDVADLRRWVISGAIVVLAYGAVAAAMLKWHEEIEAEELSGAIVVEFAPAPVGPAVVNTDIPPGPEQVMSEAVPEKVETAPPEEPPPEVKPAPNPEVPVEPTPQEVKPEPRQEPRPPVPTTSAPQAMPTQTALVPAAPLQGRPTPRISTAIPSWTSRLAAALERNKRYPPAAQARGEQGVTQVFFTLDRQGHLIDSRIVRSSGAPILDDEAIALLHRAQPFPPPPAELSGPQVGLTVPIRFNLK
jgi:periplasmic protein TonB